VRRLLFLALVAGIFAASAVAQQPLTKEQIIKRSAPICRDIIEASTPHLERADEAAKQGNINRFIKESRRAIFEVRPYVRDLRELQQPTGARKYKRFVHHGSVALDWLDLALDALEAEREDLARERQAIALQHAARAKQAAKRYGLRRPCIRVVS
jgi:hypothetical protein